MYQFLLFCHSNLRWLMLLFVLFAIYKAYVGYSQGKVFSKSDNTVKSLGVILGHTQMVVGLLIYMESPFTMYFWSNIGENIKNFDIAFIGLYHPLLMLVSVVLLTMGSAISKKKETDYEKFKTIFKWFVISLVIVLVSIPWPFYSLLNQPAYFR